MADLEKIQFLRSTVAGKTPTTSQLADGELAINMADYAIYTKNGSSIVQLAGKGIPETNTKKLTVDGPSALNDTVTVAEGKTITFTNENLSGEITRHIVGKCASNDGWYIGSGGTSNNGILEIGTIDDGTETIQFVQRGAGNVEARKLVLLDGSGNTTLPGDLRLTTNKAVKISNGSTLTLEMGVGANDVYIKNLKGSGVLQLTNDSNLSFRNYQVYYAMSGKGPGKDGTLLTNVENERQLKQDNFPVTTGTETRWIKVALLKDPGSSQSRLQLMVTNGGNYGNTHSSIDFIDCSARSIPATLTSANISSYLQIRRIGDPGIDNTNQMRYSLVRTSEGLELWFTQRAFIGGVKVALLSIAGYTEYYLPTGYTTSATAPEGLVESVAIRIYDEMNKPNLDNGTDGILSIAKGGTGASTADAARTNLGAVARAGDTMTGNLTINANLKVENPNGTMVDLGSENSEKYSRLTLARKVGDGATVAMLKVTPEGHVQFGYQTAVATPAPSKYILVKSSGLEVEGDLVFNQTYSGAEEAIDISDKTVDLNSLVIKKSGLGTRQLYKCMSSGGGNNISNKPTSDGNFVLEVLSLRKVSETDWSCKQTFTTKNGGVEGTYIRYAQNGSWSAWKEVVAGVQPINLGGTGATSVAAARNNLGVGEWQSVAFGVLNVNGVSNADPTITFKNGAMVREAQGGSTGALIMSASSTAAAAAKYIAFRPFGDSSGTEIRVKANGSSEPLLEWSYGPGIRSNSTGAFVIYAKTGQALHLRPNGDSSNQATVIDQNGKMTVGGEFEAQNSKITGNLSVSEDNRMIVLGKNSDIGLVKKSGMSGKMAISKSNSFTIMVSTNTNNQINPADTFNDIFKVDADGNQTVYGNAQINRQLTVSSAATVNGVINANGGIIVPTTKYVQIADAPTQNNQATNKKYVDDKVASAISNAGDTYLPLAGGTVTGNLDVTGTRLKTWQLEVDSKSTLRGGLDVSSSLKVSSGNLVAADTTNAGGLFAKNGNVYCDAGSAGTNSNYWFRDSAGNTRGVIWSNGQNGDMIIRNQSGRELVFRNDGYLQLAHLAPGNTDNANTVNGIRLQRGDTIFDSFNAWQSGEYVRAGWHFYNASGVDQWLALTDTGVKIWGSAANLRVEGVGNFWDVEIRSDRRVKSNIAKIDNALDKVSKLSGNVYDLQLPNGDTKPSAGLIAQEVQEVLPEAVTTDNDKDALLRLNYNAVIALLVESVKELKAEIEELKSK